VTVLPILRLHTKIYQIHYIKSAARGKECTKSGKFLYAVLESTKTVTKLLIYSISALYFYIPVLVAKTKLNLIQE
jgi:hypothetical protein